MNAVGQSSPLCLADWLVWQASLHDQAIDLGLTRIRQVATRLAPLVPAPLVITVGGTNGKGSAVAMLEAILGAAGYRVGSYSSPSLRRFTEQIRIAGQEVDDAPLCQAFQRVEAARGETSLTAFEFSTLAVLDLFSHSDLQVAVLEVGLGGRLDAVNVVDADAALITTVDLDHQDWLGADRESIGWHKAGIFRAGRLAVCADPDPPQSLLKYAADIGAVLCRQGVDFEFSRCRGDQWYWRAGDTHRTLPLPGLPGGHQLSNAAGVLALLNGLQQRLPLSEVAIASGLQAAWLPGRSWVVGEPVQWWLDVAHNAQALDALAASLVASPRAGKTRAVVAMLGNKDATALRCLADLVDVWYPATLSGPRGRNASQLADLIGDWQQLPPPAPYPDVAAACEAAARDADGGDRIVVFGSFLSVAAALEADPMRQWNHDR